MRTYLGLICAFETVICATSYNNSIFLVSFYIQNWLRLWTRTKINAVPTMKKILIILPMILIIGLTGCQEKKLAYPEGSSKHTFDYNVIVSALNTLILGFIAWRAFETTRRYNHSLIRPNIFANNLIKKDLYNPDSYNYIWTLGNTSKHPAINMLIRHTINKEENGKTRIIGATKWVSCSTLAGEQSIELFWINHAYSIEICYTDISGDKYYLSTVGALMVKTRKLKKKNYDHYVQEAIDNRSNNIVTS